MSLATLRMSILAALDGYRNLEEIITLTGRWEMSELGVWQRPTDILQWSLQYVASVWMI